MPADARAHVDAIRAAGPITAELREWEPAPGGPDRPAILSLRWSGGKATLYSTYVSGPEANAILRELADLLPDRLRVSAAASAAFAERDRERSRRRAAEERLAATLTGRGPGTVWGEALVRVAGDGSAWLLDPAKRERGFGLRFGSLADLWRAHPELRPVRWGHDGDEPFLIVAPMAMEVADADR